MFKSNYYIRLPSHKSYYLVLVSELCDGREPAEILLQKTVVCGGPDSSMVLRSKLAEPNKDIFSRR